MKTFTAIATVAALSIILVLGLALSPLILLWGWVRRDDERDALALELAMARRRIEGLESDVARLSGFIVDLEDFLHDDGDEGDDEQLVECMNRISSLIGGNQPCDPTSPPAFTPTTSPPATPRPSVSPRPHTSRMRLKGKWTRQSTTG